MTDTAAVSEPSPNTMEEIGRLCGAWAYLEARTEATIWGLLGADFRLGQYITWRLDLRLRWQMIMEEAPERLPPQDFETLKRINRDLIPVMRDRNIIVHGVVHAIIMAPANMPRTAPLPHESVPSQAFLRVPCWTVFRGSQAGKSFPISAKAVSVVRENAQKLGRRVFEFNEAHGYRQTSQMTNAIEANWPLPLE